MEKKRGFFGRMTSKIGLVDEDTEEEANDEDQGTVSRVGYDRVR